MTDKKTSNKPSTKPVIYVHAKGRGKISESSVQELLKLGLPLCSRLPHTGMTKTANGYHHPGLLLTELAGLFPGRPVIFLRVGLQLSLLLLEKLTLILAQTDQPVALTVLSNGDDAVNPFCGLQAPGHHPDHDLAELVGLLAPGKLYALTSWTDHFAILSADLVTRLSDQPPRGPLIQQVLGVGGALKLADHLLIHDSTSRVFKPLKLQPHETACPPAFSELSSRLQEWFNAGITDFPFESGEDRPSTLHISHSWGGGIAHWLKSFIEADTPHRHFQLLSEDKQTGLGYGQKISLYAGNELSYPIASWWLQPPIESIADADAAYKEILAEVCRRFEIGRIFISSLIGHSLDALRTGLPTVQVLHDHFPVWPLLGVNPEPYLSADTGADIGKALSEHKQSRNFPDKGSKAWSDIRASYLHAVDKFDVKITAPGQWVLDLQNKLEPGFERLRSKVIPHGFPALAGLEFITPKPREDGRLRMVILGRMQEGKGQKLLSLALPELAKHVQIYLLGTGKPGEEFFGVSGVDVILEYDREDLSTLLHTIGPDFAALLSVVPETFSYTLSELQQLGIPAMATRVGSFPERIEHNETGWLVDADANAVVNQVTKLCGETKLIKSVRKNLSSVTAGTPLEMVKAYNRFCPPKKNVQAFIPAAPGPDQVQWAAADYQRFMVDIELRNAHVEQKKLLDDVDQRTLWAQKEQKVRQTWEIEAQRLSGEVDATAEWALGLSQDLEQERRLRDIWVEQLETEISNHLNALHEARQDLQRMGQLESDYKVISEEHSLILQSTSWKITRPLRAGRRVARNFMLARAWNPLRWPWLVANQVRNLRTLGAAGTLQRMQSNNSQVVPQPPAEAVTTLDVEIKPGSGADQATPGPFEVFDQPDVSIVIPVFNKWAYTAACLSSLLEVKCKYSFEVIVVDDQSSDETADQLGQMKGLVYLRNDQNLGFVGSCNRGANIARGEFLVLLNNDTQVTDGWLDELVGTFDLEPGIGLVGSRLVYPDGKLQESGGIIFNDASGWNYGRGDDAEQPEYHFLREVDYCSGACIALRTAYFHEIGALDERYSPAYYEDTDLAFRVRESGYKVMVQPWSVVIHHEGVTSGTDTSCGTKKYQLINQEKFLDRWQSELASQPRPVPDPYDRRVIRNVIHHRDKGQILFIDAHTPQPDKDSGSVRLTNLLQIFRELGYGVTFFADNRAYMGKYTRSLQKSGIEVLYQPWLASLSDFFRSRGHEFDYVFISRHYVAANYVQMLRRYCPNARFIFDTVDLHYLREQRLAELEKSRALKITARQTRRAELSVIKAADATLVVSSVEKDVLAEDAPGAKVHILSNIHPVPGRGKDFSERKDMYFVGAYQHPPNIDAACWFVNDIWPMIQQELPEVRFHLIGSNAPDKISCLQGNGVVFHGHVESLQPFLGDCRLAVAPLRYGAGVKGKVNMSMAHGQPMVVTPAAGEGLFAEHEREFLLAEDAESFAREVVRLYQDETLWYKLSDASVKNVEAHFSAKAARDNIESLFDTFSP